MVVGLTLVKAVPNWWQQLSKTKHLIFLRFSNSNYPYEQVTVFCFRQDDIANNNKIEDNKRVSYQQCYPHKVGERFQQISSRSFGLLGLVNRVIKGRRQWAGKIHFCSPFNGIAYNAHSPIYLFVVHCLNHGVPSADMVIKQHGVITEF